MNMKKFCSICLEEKFLTEFHRRAEAKNHLDCACKACRSKIAKEYYQEHKEFLKRQCNAYWHAHRETYSRNAKAKYWLNKVLDLGKP